MAMPPLEPADAPNEADPAEKRVNGQGGLWAMFFAPDNPTGSGGEWRWVPDEAE